MARTLIAYVTGARKEFALRTGLSALTGTLYPTACPLHALALPGRKSLRSRYSAVPSLVLTRTGASQLCSAEPPPRPPRWWGCVARRPQPTGAIARRLQREPAWAVAKTQDWGFVGRSTFLWRLRRRATCLALFGDVSCPTDCPRQRVEVVPQFLRAPLASRQLRWPATGSHRNEVMEIGPFCQRRLGPYRRFTGQGAARSLRSSLSSILATAPASRLAVPNRSLPADGQRRRIGPDGCLGLTVMESLPGPACLKARESQSGHGANRL